MKKNKKKGKPITLRLEYSTRQPDSVWSWLETNRRFTPHIPAPAGIPMLLWCPECRARHVDEGEFATKPHHTHACQSCGHVWRPALVDTRGVRFLPGFKNP
jgi:rubredoxin